MLPTDEKVFLLAKVFSEKRYAEEFLQGRLHANRLSEFKRITDDFARGDEYEGGVMIDPDGISMVLQRQDSKTGEVQEVVLEGQHFGSSIKMQLPYFDDLNLFCMYGVRLGDLVLTPENTTAIKDRVSLTERFYDFGNHVVVITNASKFINRVVIAANRERYGLEFDFVTYYDPEIGTKLIPQTTETIFAKRKEYAWQGEFRFVFDTFTQGDEAVVLDIGKIDDIAVLWNTSEMIDPSLMILKKGTESHLSNDDL